MLIRHQSLLTYLQGNVFQLEGELTIRSWVLKGLKCLGSNKLHLFQKHVIIAHLMDIRNTAIKTDLNL